jgi:hypothetical protein
MVAIGLEGTVSGAVGWLAHPCHPTAPNRTSQTISARMMEM